MDTSKYSSIHSSETTSRHQSVESHNIPYLSPYNESCEGARDPSRYVIAFNVVAAKTAKRFSHKASDGLDRINAFDLAEISRMNLGQLNIIKVSSFCGPDAFIWGYDLARHDNLTVDEIAHLTQWDGSEVPVYDAEPLIESAQALFGSVDKHVFPIAPGSHTPAAIKDATLASPGVVYSACAIGIRQNGDRSATILMENVAALEGWTSSDFQQHEETIRHSICASVLEIAKNQRTRCSAIFVKISSIEVGHGEVGCALAIAPYISLARDALPEGGMEQLASLRLSEWRELQASRADSKR